MSIKSINQPAGVQMTTVLPNSVNQPAANPRRAARDRGAQPLDGWRLMGRLN